MSNKVYDVLSTISRIALPIGTFLAMFCNIWGLPYGDQIAATLSALDALLGAILIIESKSYQKLINKLKEQGNAVSVREEE